MELNIFVERYEKIGLSTNALPKQEIFYTISPAAKQIKSVFITLLSTMGTRQDEKFNSVLTLPYYFIVIFMESSTCLVVEINTSYSSETPPPALY